MTATRSTRGEYAYRKYMRGEPSDVCAFCQIPKGDPQYCEETDSLRVIRNRFPYSVWDGQGVVDHLMVIPKEHTNELSMYGTDVALEYVELLSKYEADGYNVYARSRDSKTRSVYHQHTHLIKLDGKHKIFVLFFRKPFYVRLSL